MFDTVTIFLVELVCGIVVDGAHFSQQRKKIKFYESYIHQRLEEALPRAVEKLKLH
jgi:hypothetical protein